MQNRTCTVDGCDKPTRSRAADWCKMHYHRWYRHGDVNRVATEMPSVSKGRRYRTVAGKGHPLAMKNGRVYEHRFVLYNEIGEGPHACYWCETEVDWLPKGDPRELHPDHLNGDGGDNRPENLVPSCRRCNVLRGTQQRADVLRASGWWSRNDTVGKLGPRAARVA